MPNTTIILYTTHCPLCRGLEKTLQSKNITFEICTDKKQMEELGINRVPKLKVGDELFSHKEALAWIMKQE